MKFIPVLDLLGGVVVRGIAGRRKEYRPIQSALAPSSQPLAVARAFRDRFDLTTLYVADLDAILGGEPAVRIYRDLWSEGFRLWVDAGIREASEAESLAKNGVEGLVIGLETVAGPDQLSAACARFGERVIFSLDLHSGKPLGERRGWRHPDAWSIACEAVALGVRRVLILDLAQVGVYAGTGTEEFCARLAGEYPRVEVYAGGGVRGIDDLRRLQNCGVQAVLVASALHDGRLTRAEMDSLRPPLIGG